MLPAMKNAHSLALVLALCSTPALAGTPPNNPASVRPVDGVQPKLPEIPPPAAERMQPDRIPLEFTSGIPFVQVTVGAAAPERMMFDSGGMIGISVPQPTIERSGSVKVLEEKERFSDLQGQVHEVSKLVAQDVFVGKTRFPAVDGQVDTHWGGENNDAKLAEALQGGVIGLDMFAARPLMLDYKRRTMSIYAAGQESSADWKNWRSLPLGYGKDGPYLTLRVAGKPKKFVLDTGAQVNLIDAGKFQCASQCPRPRLSALADTGGKALLKQDAELVDLAGAPFDGILGAPFFRSYRAVFDVAGGKLHIAAN